MRTTRSDVAKLAGVSPTTVSHVLNNTPKARVSKETRARVIECARKLNYQPNFVARSFILQKSFNIGTVICRSNESSSIQSSFAFGFIQGIQSAIKNSNYHSSLFLTSNLKELDYKTLFREKRVDGLIILQTVIPDLEILEHDLKEEQYPIIVVNNHLENTKLNYVDIDNKNGIFQAVDHLRNLGYKKIGFINGPLNQSNFIERLKALKEALKEYDLPTYPEFILEDTSENCSKIIERWARTRDYPQAIIAANDWIAIGVIRDLKKRGLSVPEDIAVVGFDDIEISAHFYVPLTTVRQPVLEIGFTAAKELINWIDSKSKNDHRQVKKILKTELVIRESCGAKLREKLLEDTKINII